MFHHRASKLKQENKSHKRGGASKRAIDNAAHGRIEKAGTGAAPGAPSGKHGAKHIAVAEMSRSNRVNHAKQLRDAKKAEANHMKRLGGGASGPARNVAIVPLSAYASSLGVASLLVDFADGAAVPAVPAGFPAPLTLTYKAFRQDVVVSAPPRGGQLGPATLASPSAATAAAEDSMLRFDVTHTLAGVRGADIVVLVVNVSPAALSATAAVMEAASESPSGKSVQVALPLHPGSKKPQRSSSHDDADDDEDDRMSSKHSLAGRSTKTGLTAGTTVAEAAAAGLVDAEGELFLACLKASGVPSLIGVIQGLEAYSSPAKQAEARKVAQRLFETEFGVDVVKVVECSDPVTYALGSRDPASSAASIVAASSSAASHLVPTQPPVPVAFTASPKNSGAAMHLCRALCAVAPKPVHWRAQRSYLSAQALFWEPSSTNTGSASEPTGTLSLYGYLRGRPLNVHQLVALPWGGHYSVIDIAEARDGMRKPPHAAHAAASTALSAEQASALVKSSSASSASVVGGSVGGHGYAFSEAGSAYVPLSEAVLAVPTLAGKIKVVAVADLNPPAALTAPLAGAGAGAGAAIDGDDDDHDGSLLAVAKSHLAESLETLAPAEDEEDGGEQNLDGFDEDEDDEDDEDDDDDEEDGEEEGAAGKGKGKNSRPKGMSKYQASWLPENDEEDDDDDEEDDDEELADNSNKPKARAGASSASSSSATDAEAADGDDDDFGGEDDENDDIDVFAEGTLDPNDPEAIRRIRKRKAAQRAKDEEGRAAMQRRRRRRKLKAGAGEGQLPQGYTPSDALEEEDDDEDGSDEEDGSDNDEDEDSGMAVDSKRGSSGVSTAGASASSSSASASAADPAVSWLMKRRAAAADELLFADEKDTPVNQTARDRFQRYRGLSSFRSSPWDPKESLPADYARVYGLPNFQKAQARILAETALAEKALLTLESGAVAASKLSKREEQASLKEKRLAERKAASAKAAANGKHANADEVEMAEDGAGDGDHDDAMVAGHGAVAAAGGAVGSSRMSRKGPGSVAGGGAMTAAYAAGTQGLQEVLGDGWVATGSFVRIRIADVPLSALRDASASGGGGAPITLFSLHRHEGKTSVLHFSLQRTDTYGEPIASKEQLEFHVGGHRVFDARPVFSAGGAGTISGSTRGKADRFFLGDRVVTATCYGPISYSPCPALVFKRIRLDDDVAKRGSTEVTASAIARSVGKTYGDSVDGDAALAVAGGASSSTASASLYPAPDRLNVAAACNLRYRLVLVATGSVMGADPDRLIIKRTVLTGYPTRIKVRSATIKFMFFNPEDVAYWKPVEMYTKHGLAGTILEPLGTHGLMKCHFDKPMKQHDTVCMPLYKRVFPRWGDCYREALGLPATGAAAVDGAASKQKAGASNKTAAGASKKRSGGSKKASTKSQQHAEMLDDDDDEL